jgi:hypothetical protein
VCGKKELARRELRYFESQRENAPRSRGYDGGMCSHQEWERLGRRFQEAVDEGELREFVQDAVARMELFVEELRSRACAPADADWVRRCGRRSRTEWVA